MQYYIREIRPMIHIPYDQGCVRSDSPIIDENDWHNEDEEKELYEKYLPIVQERDLWADVRFDERFIKVELNQ